MSKAKKVVSLAILISLALALYMVERMLPIPILPVPGVKLGLANIATLVAIFLLPWHEVVAFVIVRTLLSSLFGGGLSAFLFSLSGGLLAMIVMMLLCYKAAHWVSLPTISVVGALFHNIGQILVAALLVHTWGIFLYLPLLILSAGLTGLLVGLTTSLLLRALVKSKLLVVPKTLTPLVE